MEVPTRMDACAGSGFSSCILKEIAASTGSNKHNAEHETLIRETAF
jgi:hypothetical protein